MNAGQKNELEVGSPKYLPLISKSCCDDLPTYHQSHRWDTTKKPVRISVSHHIQGYFDTAVITKRNVSPSRVV
jgi:hypothetical protein